VITGKGIELFEVGQDLVAYRNLPVSERETNISIEVPVALLHVVGRGPDHVRAQATLVDPIHSVQPNMRVDTKTEHLSHSLLVPADPQAAGYFVGSDVVRLRSGIAVEAGMLLEALVAVVQDQAVVSYIPFQPEVIYRVTVVGTEGEFVGVASESGAQPLVPVGTVVRLRIRP